MGTTRPMAIGGVVSSLAGMAHGEVNGAKSALPRTTDHDLRAGQLHLDPSLLVKGASLITGCKKNQQNQNKKAALHSLHSQVASFAAMMLR